MTMPFSCAHQLKIILSIATYRGTYSDTTNSYAVVNHGIAQTINPDGLLLISPRIFMSNADRLLSKPELNRKPLFMEISS
jgi:hypothetical protein